MNRHTCRPPIAVGGSLEVERQALDRMKLRRVKSLIERAIAMRRSLPVPELLLPLGAASLAITDQLTAEAERPNRSRS